MPFRGRNGGVPLHHPFWNLFIVSRSVTTVTTSMTSGDNLSQYT